MRLAQATLTHTENAPKATHNTAKMNSPMASEKVVDRKSLEHRPQIRIELASNARYTARQKSNVAADTTIPYMMKSPTRPSVWTNKIYVPESDFHREVENARGWR